MALNGSAGTGQHVDGNRNTIVFHSVPKFPDSLGGRPSMIMAAWGGTGDQGGGERWESYCVEGGGRPGHWQDDGDHGDGGQDQDLRQLRRYTRQCTLLWYHDPRRWKNSFYHPDKLLHAH